MSEFNWSAYDRWCSRKEWARDSAEHKETCCCRSCHEWHVKEKVVEANAKEGIFECCDLEMEERKNEDS